MVKKDYHVHTTYSDGKDDMESVVKYAVKNGCTELGFSDHSYTFFDESYCMKRSSIPAYFKEIERLKKTYGDKIKILVGIEQDYYSKTSVKNYDYAIGSVHYFKANGRYYPIDESKEGFISAVNEIFNGDYLSACENYFATVKKFAGINGVKIIGHFDLITKYNGDGELFDESSERYIKAYKTAAKALVKAGKVFEINTGAYRKKLRGDAYPDKPVREYIKSIGGKFLLSSDAHKKEDLFFAFDEFSD